MNSKLELAKTEVKELMGVMGSVFELLSEIEGKLIFLETYIMTMEEFDPNYTDDEASKHAQDRIDNEIEEMIDIRGGTK